MIGALYCFLGFAWTYSATRKSIGRGLVVLLASGYLYGLMRGRYMDGLTHFGFDAALIAFYLAHFTLPTTHEQENRQRDVVTWVVVLCVWPFVCMTYSPLMQESQPFIIQLVGLRATMLAVPCILIGARMTREDLDAIAPWIAVFNLFALAIAGIEYVFGVEAVMPRNAVTELMYMSNDVRAGGEMYHRIPSTFAQSHVYGATMNMSLPFLAHGLESTKRIRLLCAAGLAAAIIGVFVSGARTPVVFLGISVVYVLFTLRVRASTWMAFVAVCAVMGYVVLNNQRLQRFETLGDRDLVEERLMGSMNTSFFDAVGEHPLGSGLASGWGTSIPHFLQSEAKPQFGLESEYVRIVIDTGIPGVAMWSLFFITVLRRGDTSQGNAAMKAFSGPMIALTMIGGTLGAGMFTGIPSAQMFLLLVGIRCAQPGVAVIPLALRHVGRRLGAPRPNEARPIMAAGSRHSS